MEFKRKCERFKEASESLDIRPNDLLLCQSCWTTEHSTNKKDDVFYDTNVDMRIQEPAQRQVGERPWPKQTPSITRPVQDATDYTVLPNTQKPESNTVDKNYKNIESNNLQEQSLLPSQSPFQSSPPASEDSTKSCLASPTPRQSSSTAGSASNESADIADVVVFEDLISYLTVNKKSGKDSFKFHETWRN